ncbi:ROK family protein [Clostridium sp. KNHs214]|uniref:ROK family protein n=1 Tax=Clostridium sp. KNHs214 TaxID=1540257 RepID=UPI000554E088|nr:ROK family protein [Clostridium sp. KNHs214]
MKYLAVDIGGTGIKYGVVEDDGNVIVHYSMDTEACRGADCLIEKVKNIIRFLLKEHGEDIGGIGISTAGQVNRVAGEIVFATEAIPGWTGVKLKEIIEKEFSYGCYVDNDVNCAALGEMWTGSAKNEKNFLCLTLGTGIGGAIVINRDIFTGSSYSAGEFGHMNLYPNGLECNCGHRGCYERYASTSALVKFAQEKAETKERLNGKIIFERANNGEKIYKDIVNQWTYNIALGLKNLVHIFNPPLIIIGGGVSAQGNLITDLIKKHLDTMIMPSFSKNLMVKVASCGNKAGMLGSVYGLKNNIKKGL